jgi:hypothetical protein
MKHFMHEGVAIRAETIYQGCACGAHAGIICLIASIDMRSAVHELVSLDLQIHTFFNWTPLRSALWILVIIYELLFMHDIA